MAAVEEILFLLGMLCGLATVAAKVYNVMYGMRAYKLGVGFMLFMGFGVSWFFVLLSVLWDSYTAIFSTGLTFLSFFWVPHVLFLLIEIFITLGLLASKSVQAYKATEHREE